MILDPSIRRFFKKYIQKNLRLLGLVIAFSIFQSILLLPSVYLIKHLFDDNIPNNDIQGLLVNSFIIITLTIFQSLFSIVHRNVFLNIIKKAIKQLQQDLLHHLIRAEKAFYDQTERAFIVNRAVSDIEKTDGMVDGLLSVVIPQATLFFIAIGIMLVYNPLIGITTVILGFLGAVFQRKFRQKTLQSIRHYTVAKDRLSSYVGHLSAKHVLIKMRNSEQPETSEANKYASKVVKTGTDTAKKGWNSKVVNELVVNISATLLIVLGSIQILLGSHSYGNIFGLYFLIVFVRRTITLIQSKWSVINEGTIALENIFELIDSFPIKELVQKPYTIDFKGNIRLKNVSFGYADNHILLDSVDFDIKQGETVLITGVNGSGKSSLINLILGFYKPFKGNVFAEDTNYNNLNLGELRPHIGYVPQQQALIDGTIEQNLLLGTNDPDVLRKLKNNSIFDDLLSEFEHGLKTPVIQGGKNLSGGQIQRISIVRALASNPILLILDEPTNHLDSTSIISLHNSIKKNSKIGIIIISHHSLFKEIADKIYFLREKKLFILPKQ